jgi:hypothetical protein
VEQQGPDLQSIENQLAELRARISEAGDAEDSYRAGTAAAMGGGTFLLLLCAGAVYDLIWGGAAAWAAVGIGRSGLQWIAGGLAIAGFYLLGRARQRDRQRDRQRETALKELEAEYARLSEQRDDLGHAE